MQTITKKNKIDLMSNGDWIRAERERRYLSQAKMAKFLAIPQYILSGWETGKDIILEGDLGTMQKFFLDFDVKNQNGEISLAKRKVVRTFTHSNKINLNNHLNQLKNFANDLEEALPVKNAPKAVALFAGIGGMSLGLKQAGFNVVGHIEIDEPVRAIYENNFKKSSFLGSDIKKVSDEEVRNWKKQFGQIEILVGGPPCQGFSLAGKRNVFDPRNQLFNEFARIAKILRPKFVLLENVRTLLSMEAPDGSLIRDHLLAAFNKAGYVCDFRAVNAAEYGIPQSRERVIFIGVLKERKCLVNKLFPEATHAKEPTLTLLNNLKPFKTFRDATSDLEHLESGEKSLRDIWHFAITHPDHVIEMLRYVPEGKSAHENPNPKLRPTSGYNTTYKRLRWDEPSSTISTNFSMISGSRNVHPLNTRSLTIREAMRCQTFPDNFVLSGKLGDIRRGIGNAVPPELAKVLGGHLRSLLALF